MLFAWDLNWCIVECAMGRGGVRPGREGKDGPVRVQICLRQPATPLPASPPKNLPLRPIPKYGTITINLSVLNHVQPVPSGHPFLFVCPFGTEGFHPTMINKGAILSTIQYLLISCHVSPLPAIRPDPCPRPHRRIRFWQAAFKGRRARNPLESR